MGICAAAPTLCSFLPEPMFRGLAVIRVVIRGAPEAAGHPHTHLTDSDDGGVEGGLHAPGDVLGGDMVVVEVNHDLLALLVVAVMAGDRHPVRNVLGFCHCETHSSLCWWHRNAVDSADVTRHRAVWG